MAIIRDIVTLISGAFSDRKNLPRALISCGVLKAAVALCLLLFKAPGGIFLHHGKGLLYLYFAVLIAVVVFGIMEALLGVWVSSKLDERHAVGKTVLWVSILPLVFVAALGGFRILYRA
ncbi:hypothetical protein CFC21_090454 [Triticum aestivum]|uniref:Uncharacterized protein n=2 Tax=Triticum aestivum TaxID=4565 RepID=A0A9R1LEA0_WHEAT|nr:hypothetical protein CFC21_090448 [Triticum aestivum]KAF7087258.1 hypothetical protein CFC21_090454 [Triticum aestivum]